MYNYNNEEAHKNLETYVARLTEALSAAIECIEFEVPNSNVNKISYLQEIYNVVSGAKEIAF